MYLFIIIIIIIIIIICIMLRSALWSNKREHGIYI